MMWQKPWIRKVGKEEAARKGEKLRDVLHDEVRAQMDAEFDMTVMDVCPDARVAIISRPRPVEPGEINTCLREVCCANN